jgi:hypothetical protein
MKRLVLTTALVMAVGVAIGGVYLDTSTVKQQARQLQVHRFTLQDIDRAVYGPDGLTNPKLRSVTASADTSIGRAQVADPVIDRTHVADPVIDRTHVADPVIDRTNKTDQAFDRKRAPVQYTDGPLMTAADPDGNIVTADRPLRLEPKEYSAQASSPLPADCPQPNAVDDTAFCQ